MSEKKYRVTFSGKIINGANVNDVKRRVLALFKSQKTNMEKLFSGQKVIIQKDKTLKECKKIKKAFLQAGVLCEIEPKATNDNKIVKTDEGIDNEAIESKQKKQLTKKNSNQKIIKEKVISSTAAASNTNIVGNEKVINRTKKKMTAALLAIFLGSVGAHKFYHGNWVWGIGYILFSWTYISLIVGFIEGVIYLAMDYTKYDAKYNASSGTVPVNKTLNQTAGTKTSHATNVFKTIDWGKINEKLQQITKTIGDRIDQAKRKLKDANFSNGNDRMKSIKQNIGGKPDQTNKVIDNYKSDRENVRLNEKKKGKFLLAVIMSSVAFLLLSFITFPAIDSKADKYLEKAVKDATVAYAITRVINAGVSILKDSEVSFQPAGIGINIAVGEILDPLDDMTERLSSVLVISIVSLGVQKVAMAIGSLIPLKLISFLLLLIIFPLSLKKPNTKLILSVFIKLIFIIFIIRYLLPTSSIVNDIVYQQYFKQEIEKHINNLKILTPDIEELGSFDLPQNDGFFSKVTSAIKASQAKSEVVKEKFYELVKRRADIIESLVHLTILYAALFVFQVIVIPVFMLWIMLKIIKQVLNSSFSPKNQLISITN